MIKVHFLGIGGSGASAIAAIAESQGFEVTGCDKVINNEFTSVFKKDQLFEGHSPDHLKNVDILAITPAILSLDPNNNELLEARKQGIETLTWQKFMAKYLEKDKFVIAVCGTHGKSTTTAMIGEMLEVAGLDPTVELGAVVNKWGKNFRVGKSDFFVTEADEFNDNFLHALPDLAVVTTIEYDHPEYFKDFEAYKKSFAKFLGYAKIIIANLSDRGVQDVLSDHLIGVPTKSPDRCEIIDYSKNLIDFEIPVPGKHNILNASAVYQVGLKLNIKPEVIKKALQGFGGAGRRFEFLGNYQGKKVYSDFGHHPTEIKVTLDALREKFPDQNITVIFQPHMFSRTYALFDDFKKVLEEALVDKIYILDIYPSREVDTGLVNSKQLVEAIGKGSVEYLPGEQEVLDRINLENTDILFFLGAGETDRIAKKLTGGTEERSRASTAVLSEPVLSGVEVVEGRGRT